LFSLTGNITIDRLQDDLFVRKGISVDILRLDKVHPVISGNKLFKLHHFLQEALQSTHKHIITFGGAFSNHLAAAAFACRELGLKSTGIVRGEMPAALSHTLLQCREMDMQLQFVSREAYERKATAAFGQELETRYGPHLLVPEGGYHPMGAKGAAMIMNHVPQGYYSHIACSLGTATTVAGLLSTAAENQLVMGFCALKGMTDIDNRLHYLLDGSYNPATFLPVHDYCFAGYAKKDPAVFSFMNRLWQEQRIPTDFVYTAKMLYGVYDMADNDFFTPGSCILCLHTGGLQGNLSLPVETLTFENI
jgi:1-aminocyclopropane-1-carboxylate deaminase